MVPLKMQGVEATCSQRCVGLSVNVGVRWCADREVSGEVDAAAASGAQLATLRLVTTRRCPRFATARQWRLRQSARRYALVSSPSTLLPLCPRRSLKICNGHRNRRILVFGFTQRVGLCTRVSSIVKEKNK